jgi:hypothetical protein
MELIRASGSVSEPDTPPSEREDSNKDVRSLHRSCDSLGRETPPPQLPKEHARHLEPRRAPQGPDSEDVAATLMALRATNKVSDDASSSAPTARKAKKISRKRKSNVATAAPAEQPKRRTMGPADRQAVYVPSVGQVNSMVGPGVIPHFSVYTHGPNHSAAAFAQQQAPAAVWRPVPQAQQAMVSRAAHSPQPVTCLAVPALILHVAMFAADGVRSRWAPGIYTTQRWAWDDPASARLDRVSLQLRGHSRQTSSRWYRTHAAHHARTG